MHYYQSATLQITQNYKLCIVTNYASLQIILFQLLLQLSKFWKCLLTRMAETVCKIIEYLYSETGLSVPCQYENCNYGCGFENHLLLWVSRLSSFERYALFSLPLDDTSFWIPLGLLAKCLVGVCFRGHIMQKCPFTQNGTLS